MGKKDAYIKALKSLGDGRFHYYDGRAGGIGCSEYTRQALVEAGIIKSNEYFHAASGNAGCLEDRTRFDKLPWNPASLQEGDILWSNGHHVATWDGGNGVYEAAPENSHGICDNGKTGVGRWSRHTYYNCGTGTNNWSCIYRIKEEAEEVKMDRQFNLDTIIKYLPVIKYGSKGDYVKCLQTILQKYGWYAGDIDGHAGNMTVNGIKLAQTAVGLYTDGICGEKTWTRLVR